MLPPFDLGFIAFPCPAFGLLAAPMQELLYQFPYVAFMILNIEKLLNQVRYALGSPQLIGPAMCFRALAQKEFQLMKLTFRQLARSAGRRNRLQPVNSAARHRTPAVERSAIDAENLSNLSM